jgi:hemerythrin-like domain-containing protein
MCPGYGRRLDRCQARSPHALFGGVADRDKVWVTLEARYQAEDGTIMLLNLTHVAETPDDLLSDPIGWFFAEHQRHRLFCDLMQKASIATSFEPDPIAWLLKFVVQDLSLHVLDEEQDLFPLLRARGEPEDHIDALLGRLTGEHAKDLSRAAAVRQHLETCLRLKVPISRNNGRRRSLQAFATQERSHLALENAAVLPIARLRLSEDDLLNLASRLAARRDVTRRPAEPSTTRQGATASRRRVSSARLTNNNRSPGRPA